MGHNPYPANTTPEAMCCERCDERIVIPARLFISDAIHCMKQELTPDTPDTESVTVKVSGGETDDAEEDLHVIIPKEHIHVTEAALQTGKVPEVTRTRSWKNSRTDKPEE